jgi:rhamnosyltransferase
MVHVSNNLPDAVVNRAVDQAPPSRVAVLLASYNGLRYIHEQVDSILRQKGCVVDIFVSDDQSTDGTWEWLNEKKLSEPRLHLLARKDRFRNAARNFYRLLRDVDFSNYDYVALSDQDDIWLDDKLLHSIQGMLEHHCDAVSSNVIAVWADGRQKLVHKSHRQRGLDFLFGSAGPGCTYLLTAECSRKLSAFLTERRPETEEVQFHDWLIYAWVRAHGLTWHIEPRPTMFYRQHGSNEYGVNSGWAAFRRRLHQVRSGWYRQQILKISRLVSDGTAFTDEARTTIRLVEQCTFTSRLALIAKVSDLRREPKDRVLLVLTSLFGGI